MALLVPAVEVTGIPFVIVSVIPEPVGEAEEPTEAIFLPFLLLVFLLLQEVLEGIATFFLAQLAG